MVDKSLIRGVQCKKVKLVNVKDKAEVIIRQCHLDLKSNTTVNNSCELNKYDQVVYPLDQYKQKACELCNNMDACNRSLSMHTNWQLIFVFFVLGMMWPLHLSQTIKLNLS